MSTSNASPVPHPFFFRSVLLAGASGLLLAGCGSYPESHVVSAPPPAPPAQQVVVAQTQPAAATVVQGTAVQTTDGTIVVMQAPPALQQEVVTARPSSDHIWIPGYWTWRNQRYEWTSGRWQIPPRPGAVWMAPTWERLADGSYRFTEGHWQ